MAEFVTLSCPSCGGKLELTANIERFACAHCGKEHIVKRGGGIVSLSPVVDALKKVEMGVDKTASELAISRLQREIDDFERQKAIIIANSPPQELNILSVVLIMFGFLITVLALATFQVNGLGAGLFIGIGMAGSGIIWIYTHNSSENNRRLALRTHLQPIENEIEKRLIEQAKHRAIVSQ